ncbi:MAG: adenylate/guanylate cyclase domain-containing protein, partial [Betaproteobacteria bacterium]
MSASAASSRNLLRHGNSLRASGTTLLASDLSLVTAPPIPLVRPIEEHRFAACVVTDADNYTELAERMNPCELVDLLNDYFKTLFAPVQNNGGVVLDVKGDGLLAVWTGTLSDADLRNSVCKACLEMMKAVDEFNARHPRQQLGTRIGVGFGPIALADVGALSCFQYRAVGDTVNTSSRTEQLNKELGTHVLVPSSVARGNTEHLFRNLGTFQLRGKRETVDVLELVAGLGTATREQKALCERFDFALRTYRAGRYDQAVRLFREIARAYPDDKPTRFYVARCSEILNRGLQGALRCIVRRIAIWAQLQEQRFRARPGRRLHL